MTTEGRVPRKMLRQRAIQIGVKGPISKYYVQQIITIEGTVPIKNIASLFVRDYARKYNFEMI